MNGARFDNKFTREYGAIMNYARITPAAVKENYVDVPGGDSSIDLTETVGGISYGDGTIDFKFTLLDFSKKERMKNDFHGRRMNIVLDREPEVYYDGRVCCNMDEWMGNRYKLGFSAKVKPYKQDIRETVHLDSVSGNTKEIILVNSRMPAIPEITVDGNIDIVYEEQRYSMKSGIYKSPEITLYEGLNRLTISGKGNVKIAYRKGHLV